MTTPVPQRRFESAEPVEASVLHGWLAAGETVLLTPNHRLAAYYRAMFDGAQRVAGRRAWPSADILPWPAFVERAWRRRRDGADAPTLLSDLQCQMVWEQIVRKSPDVALLNSTQTAKQAMAAWKTACAWQLLPAMRSMPVSEDAAMFLDWANRFIRDCREKHFVDAARLPDFWSQSIATAQPGLPSRVLAVGFDIVTPQQSGVLRKLGEAGVDVRAIALTGPAGGERRQQAPSRLEFSCEDDEIHSCASWARWQIEQGVSRRIAIVVPDLRGKRSQVARALTDALRPGARVGQFGDAGKTAGLFNISLGPPLGEYALVSDALEMIEFTLARPMPFVRVSGLMRSPFMRGAGRELAARARLDAALRRRAPVQISLPALRQLVHVQPGLERLAQAAPDWLAMIGARQVAPSDRQSPHAWSRTFARALAHWGFPGDAPLDSMQHQVLAKFREALEVLASLQTVRARMRAEDALSQLRRIVADTLFQPEDETGGTAPVQVLGVLESGGQSFDAIWVSGLADDAWPQPARPNPFIPAALQRGANVPEGSATASLALDQRITNGWLASAPEVIFSHARRAGDGSGDQERGASALISQFAADGSGEKVRFPAAYHLANAMRAGARLEAYVEPPLPRLAPGTLVRGGAKLLADQAACPFRALVRHRLGAQALETPVEGLDAAERGSLLHRVLYLLWRDIKDSATLGGLSADTLSIKVMAAADSAIADARAGGATVLSGRFADVERTRLARLCMDWLAYEKQRGAFQVVHCEAPRQVTFSGIRMDLRLDRVDRFADGTHALIDYKTGDAKVTGWLGARPDDPQLPLYFLMEDVPVSALAYARVKRGGPGKDFGFEGVSAVEGMLPDVAPIENRARLRNQGYASWDVLTAEWETSLAGLVEGLMDGFAPVDPKHGGVTCARCDLQGVCRIAERGAQATGPTGETEGQSDE